MVVVTRAMGFVREVAARVIFIDGGNILEQGPPESFFGNPRHLHLQDFRLRCHEKTEPEKNDAVDFQMFAVQAASAWFLREKRHFCWSVFFDLRFSICPDASRRQGRF